jgi:hypothetical protein
MTFNEMIDKIMPEVERGGAEPFLIYRDADGGWHGDFTKNQYGETHDWVAETTESDKAAFVTRGLDFAGGGMPYVCDKVLSQRLRNEYYNVWSYDQSAEHKKVYALLNFFEDNAAAFSRDVTDCLTTVERPLAALLELCPFNMATGREGRTFNEDLAPDAVDKIEYAVRELLPDKRLIDALRDNYASRGVGDMGLFNLMLFIEEHAGDVSGSAKARLLQTAEPLDWLGAELYEKGYALDKGIGGKGVVGVSDVLSAIERILADEPANDSRVAALGGDVEAADRDGGNADRSDTARIISTIALENRQIIIGEDTSNPEPFRVEVRTDGERVVNTRTGDYLAALKAYAALIHDNVSAMELDREEQTVKYGVRDIKLTAEHILPGSESADFTKRLIIVDPACLMPEYRASTSQLVECSHGNGARPNAIGTSVFGTEMFSGKSVVYGRHQILGIADESVLPKWAGIKLEARRDGTVFEYGGYHFKPCRKFEKRDGEFYEQTRNASSDRTLGMATYDWYKSDYSHASFFAASGNADAEIFLCLENGKLYVPGENELFMYNEPPQKEITARNPQTTQKKETAQNPPQQPRKKPSLLGKLDSNKAKVARDKAANPAPPGKNMQREVGD